MPHRNKIRARVGVAGHHIGFNQRGSNGIDGNTVSNERGSAGMRQPYDPALDAA